MNRFTFSRISVLLSFIALLGCTPSSSKQDPPPAPAMSLSLVPGDASVRPGQLMIAYFATFMQNGQPSAFQGTPTWEMVGTPSDNVGTLEAMPDIMPNDPNKKAALYTAPLTLPAGVTRVSFQIRVRTAAGTQTLEAVHTLALDVNAPPILQSPDGSLSSFENPKI